MFFGLPVLGFEITREIPHKAVLEFKDGRRNKVPINPMRGGGGVLEFKMTAAYHTHHLQLTKPQRPMFDIIESNENKIRLL